MAVGQWARYRRELGRRGESLAAAHLERSGMRILARNWSCAAGEIDIVARWGATLVIAEVKTRTSTRFGHPVEAVTPRKRRRLRRLARVWARRHRVRARRIRVDAVSVLVAPRGRVFIAHDRGIA